MQRAKQLEYRFIRVVKLLKLNLKLPILSRTKMVVTTLATAGWAATVAGRSYSGSGEENHNNTEKKVRLTREKTGRS